MICIGHRGALGHEPENTVLSVRTAIELGADWVEIDVYAVGGELIVIHDDRLERTTNGQGYVIEHSVEYLRSLDAGKGQNIPTLAEVFDAVNGRVGVNVELKGAGAADPAAALVRQRIEGGLSREQVLISSFNHRELQRVREIAPELQLGALMVGLPVDDALFAQELGAYSVHPSLEFIDQRFVDDAHGRGLKVFPLTVNHPDDISRMAALGVDGVFSDYPERVVHQSSM